VLLPSSSSVPSPYVVRYAIKLTLPGSNYFREDPDRRGRDKK